MFQEIAERIGWAFVAWSVIFGLDGLTPYLSTVHLSFGRARW